MREVLERQIGVTRFYEYIQQAPCHKEDDDTYGECAVAEKLGMQLRLVYKRTRPTVAIYPQARVLRYAAFMGLDIMELDFISSHGRQALKYARTHGLRCVIMHEAFATADHIKAFRDSLALPSQSML